MTTPPTSRPSPEDAPPAAPDQAAQPGQTVDLAIGGMTCASCAARIEKKLNRIPGVVATVNYATEKARVALPAGTAVEAVIATVEATGYTARRPEPTRRAQTAPGDNAAGQGDATQDGEPDGGAVAALRQRLTVSAALTLPVLAMAMAMAMAMIPPMQFDSWHWLSLTLAAPVVVWGAWPFHRAAWANARHGAATMDTLISVGVLAAFGWSLYVLFLGEAGDPRMRMAFDLLPQRAAGAHEIYLEVAAAVTVFILAGRYFEARAKTRSGAALRALLAMGAKDIARAA